MREIRVYTTSYCSFCTAAKRLLTKRGYPYVEIDLSDDHDQREKLSRENHGYRTVPMIFIGDKFIGGYTELSQFDASGALAGMVDAP